MMTLAPNNTKKQNSFALPGGNSLSARRFMMLANNWDMMMPPGGF